MLSFDWRSLVANVWKYRKQVKGINAEDETVSIASHASGILYKSKCDSDNRV